MRSTVLTRIFVNAYRVQNIYEKPTHPKNIGKMRIVTILQGIFIIEIIAIIKVT